MKKSRLCLVFKARYNCVRSLNVSSDHMVPVTRLRAALMEMLLSILVSNGIFLSALSLAAVTGTVYACEVCRIEHY